MKRIILLLLLVASAAHAQILPEFRLWYLDKQLSNAALLVNAQGNNALVSFSPGRYSVRFPSDTFTFRNYQYLATATYHPDKSPHHFGTYVFGQQDIGHMINLNYAYELEVGRRTNLALGGNLGMYQPFGNKDSDTRAFRYGIGAALQSKNKENFVGLSLPYNLMGVTKGHVAHVAYRTLVLQGGYTFYMHHNWKFIPTLYWQVGAFRPREATSPLDVVVADVAFRYKEFFYINGALGVQDYRFGKVKIQRFGAGVRPKPWLMVGYQRDALDATDYKYHGFWVRCTLPKTAPSP